MLINTQTLIDFNLPFLIYIFTFIPRYASVAPIAVPHKALADSEICGFRIRKGTVIWPYLWGLAHDENVWDDPWSFSPERFLDDHGYIVPADHSSRVNSVPFGAGLRVCPGEVFTLSRMFIFLAMMIQNFEFLPAIALDEQPSCDSRDMTWGIVLQTLPYQVRLRSRNE